MQPLTIDLPFQNDYLQLPPQFYKHQKPEAVTNPRLLLLNAELCNFLNVDLSKFSDDAIANLLSGNQVAPQSAPIATAYAGHQFGYFNILGDGRALLLGELLAANNKIYDVQLKGSGRTPYSRSGDGRATLSAMLREYLISEAMHYLGIATTRSLAVVTSGEPVNRKPIQPGAILTRVASSHIRIGTFEFAAHKLDTETLKTLLRYAASRHYPELLHDEKNLAINFLSTVTMHQIDLLINWMRVGFIHGVMNTDNISIAGETIDYGPCAFLDQYSPAAVFSSIDTQGRYAFGNQPPILQWNLACLASALLPLIDEKEQVAIEKAKEILNNFPQKFKAGFLEMMCQKLGITKPQTDDQFLVDDLLSWMEKQKADYTHTFSMLSGHFKLSESMLNDSAFKQWYDLWQTRLLQQHQDETWALMRKTNPIYIPRNQLVEDALFAAWDAQNMDLFNNLLQVLKNPYRYQAGYDYMALPPTVTNTAYQTYCGT